MPPQPKSPAFQPCPWNVQDWSGTEDSSDTCPDASASSAQEPFTHSFALAQVRLPHQVRPPTTAPTLPQPNNNPNPPAGPNTPIPRPKPKPPPPQHLLSNAGSILPPLPAGPRSAQRQFSAVPMQSFCSRYQNRTCRRQCALHMSALQRAHAHVFALHGLPAQALMPIVVRPDTSLASATYWPASGPTLAHKTAAHSTSLTGGLPAGTWQACQCLTRTITPTMASHRAQAPLPQWVPSPCRCLA